MFQSQGTNVQTVVDRIHLFIVNIDVGTKMSRAPGSSSTSTSSSSPNQRSRKAGSYAQVVSTGAPVPSSSSGSASRGVTSTPSTSSSSSSSSSRHTRGDSKTVPPHSYSPKLPQLSLLVLRVYDFSLWQAAHMAAWHLAHLHRPLPLRESASQVSVSVSV